MPFTPVDDPGTPSVNERLVALVRLEISDQTSPQLFEDSEIQYKLDDHGGNVLHAAADLLDILARRFAQGISFEWQGQRFEPGKRGEVFAQLAAELRAQAKARAGNSLGVVQTTRIDGYSTDVTNRASSPSDRDRTGRRTRHVGDLV